MRLLIFTYAAAGLGHLRVTGSLVSGRPKDYPYEMLGSTDPIVTRMHRYISINPFAKKLGEAFQYGVLEDLFTSVYVWYLRRFTGKLYKNILHLIEEHPDVDGVTLIATHFGLAHQVAAVKNKIRRKTGKNIDIVVQVTDDTSQHIWCVRGADVTFVPSEQTKNQLEEYAKHKKMRINAIVSPYPTPPSFTKMIKGALARNEALRYRSSEKINVIVPVSGAAVGLKFLKDFLTTLGRLNKRFVFFVVAKRSDQSKSFLSEIGDLAYVKLATGRSDNETVGIYEKIYRENLIHIEITKPSEQAFKALINPDMVGGSILLFTDPVGRQERDNILFLKRHGLLVEENDLGNSFENNEFYPRGVLLPLTANKAANCVLRCMENGYLEKMADRFRYSPEAIRSGEVSEQGTLLFWQELQKLSLI